ncbi:hypothetical protein V1264_022900 [Littorina saxatilis]|uniref:Tc1-like transposase DDE domain-containing protein n=1 Tax=Littorina saxatilis TaxID=31220 RepID=A0AAN9B6X9_9CAEN
MPRLTPEQRERAVGRLSAGDDPEAVAVAFNVHLSTVYRLQQRFVNIGSTADAQRSGRPRVTTQRQDRQILRHHLRNRFHTANETARNTVGNHQRPIISVDRQSAEDLLSETSKTAVPLPVLTQRHRMARQQWAQDHINWNWRQWRNILFTDESRFCISHVDGRVRVWRRRGERYTGDCVMEHNGQGGPNVMVWVGIGLNQSRGPVFFNNLGPGRGNGITTQRYIDHILQPHVVPFSQARRNCVLQQDNVRPHTARVTLAFLQHNNIDIMAWPALSPDLNPIEHFWDQLQRKVNQLRPGPRTAAELRQALINAWCNIPRDAINRLIHSMRRRCQAVINVHGDNTPY